MIVLLGFGIGFLFLRPATAPEPAVPNQPSVTVSHEVILEGKIICLPHRDTSGPQTMECAYGIQASDGSNYSLDTQKIDSSNPPMYNTEDRVRATGLITPIEALSSDQWKKYDIKGIFTATTPLEKVSN